MNLSEWLPRLLNPLSVDLFLARHWEREALHIRGDPSKAVLLDFGTVALKEVAVRDSSLPLRGQYFHQGEHEDFPIRGDQIDDLYKAGLTICLSRANDGHEGLRKCAAGCKFGMQYPGIVRVNAYLSPAGGGFGTHFDAQSVMILQLEGSKRWKHSLKPAVPAPPSDTLASHRDRYHKQHHPLRTLAPEACEIVESELKPGDVLYLPAGCWHQTQAGDHSLAVTITFVPTSFLTATKTLLERASLERDGWREFLPPGGSPSTAEVAPPPSVKTFFSDRLGELRKFVNELTVADFERLWSSDVHALHLDQVPHRAALEITPSTRLKLPSPFHWATTEDKLGAVTLSVYTLDKVFALPVGTEGFLNHLSKQSTFTASDAMRWDDDPAGLSWDDTKDALEALSTFGLIATG